MGLYFVDIPTMIDNLRKVRKVNCQQHTYILSGTFLFVCAAVSCTVMINDFGRTPCVGPGVELFLSTLCCIAGVILWQFSQYLHKH